MRWPDLETGWTLVELLVTIAVVAILTGLLLPAVQRARGTAQATICKSNLRTITMAALDYTQAFDHAPAAIWRKENADGGVTTMQWDWTVQPNGTWSLGVIGQRLDRPLADLACPLWTGPTPEDDSDQPPFTGYNYNTSFVGAKRLFRRGFQAIRVGVAPSGWQHTGAVMFGIGGWSGGTNRYMRAPGNHEFVGCGNLLCRSTVFPACWRSNAFFETRWFGWGVRAPSDGGHDQGYAAQILDHPNNGFLSDDDRAYDPGLANADGTDVPNPPPEYEWWWGVRGGNWLNARWPLAAQQIFKLGITETIPALMAALHAIMSKTSSSAASGSGEGVC